VSLCKPVRSHQERAKAKKAADTANRSGGGAGGANEVVELLSDSD